MGSKTWCRLGFFFSFWKKERKETMINRLALAQNINLMCSRAGKTDECTSPLNRSVKPTRRNDSIELFTLKQISNDFGRERCQSHLSIIYLLGVLWWMQKNKHLTQHKENHMAKLTFPQICSSLWVITWEACEVKNTLLSGDNLNRRGS